MKHRECICALCEAERAVIDAARAWARLNDYVESLPQQNDLLDAVAALDAAEEKR